jgi:hypothetical protein
LYFDLVEDECDMSRLSERVEIFISFEFLTSNISIFEEERKRNLDGKVRENDSSVGEMCGCG